MLPNITNYIIEVTSLEIVNWARWKPVLQVDVAYLPMQPLVFVLGKQFSHRIVLVLCRQSELLASLCALPVAESSGFQIVHFCWPVHRQRHHFGHRPQHVALLTSAPKEWHFGLDRLEPSSTFLVPELWSGVAIVFQKL
mgnify:CR=1 FL=1